MLEVRQEINTARWTDDEDRILKDSIRAQLPRTGNLSATAAGLHRRLHRRPGSIMQRVTALRRLDPDFDRFIAGHLHSATPYGAAPRGGNRHTRSGWDRPDGSVQAARRADKPSRSTPHGNRQPARAAGEPWRQAVAEMIPWLETHIGELPEEGRQRLEQLVRKRGALPVALAMADALEHATELLINEAEATLAQWQRDDAAAASAATS